MINVKQYLIKLENLNLINHDFVLQTSHNLFILLFVGYRLFYYFNFRSWFHQYYVHQHGWK